MAERLDELLVGPIRGDLLGTEHLAARARVVARGQRLVAGRFALRPARLLARLADTRHILTEAHARLNNAARDGVDAGPAAEWLLDNYHVVQEHLQEVRASLPGGYYRQLPELANGPLTGYPRVYEMAISIISHTEARIDLENVDHYVEAFQSVSPLTVRELWAMPAMLRLGLIESVRRMTLRTVERLDEIELAGHWAELILSAASHGGDDLREALRTFAQAEHRLTTHFVSRFLQLLRQAEGASPALAWLEHWLREAGVSPENTVADSTQWVALTQIMMANSIMSLREIGRRDWRVFVERQSAMEAVLRTDPSGFYPRMTFATRDRYRHVVEDISKRTGHDEPVVAQWAVDLAVRQTQRSPAVDPRRTHVGFYLLDRGLDELERAAGYVPPIAKRVERAVHAHPNTVFIGGLAFLTVLLVLAVLWLAGASASTAPWLIVAFAFFPALDVATTVLQQLVTALLPPRTLARLDLHEHGVPEEFRTAVVVPILFGSLNDVREALDNLEVQFLANREAHLVFALLSDLTDASAEVQPDDDAIVAAALEGITALNERYAPGQAPAFHLLHRPRRWNAQEGVWMGWERKRGKLSDFNRLLRGEGHGAFSVVSSNSSTLGDVKYVITLDADTVLPPDAAPSLVGAMAHPLNRAAYDTDRKRVVHGYGILQPRVGVSLPSANRSRFASIASGHPGVDPYSTAVSDVYQDLYGEGSFTGKGIYDVDAFQLATNGRFPENTLLSHDLIEGNYARAGLATDVIVYDDYPSSYVAYTRRKHRWIRGDWQLLPWLRRVVPGPDGPEANRLSVLSRWKIVDNLRRSTVEISQLLFLIAGWTLLPGAAVRWTLLGLGAIVAPWVTSLLLAAVRPSLDKSWRAYYAAVGQDVVVCAQQAAVAIIFLPHQAFVSADAIGRTLYRMLVSRRHLLEWRSASLVERSVSNVRTQSWRAMRGSVLFVSAVAVAILVLWQQDMFVSTGRDIVPLSAIATGGLVLFWLAAPLIAARLSRVTTFERSRLSPTERRAAVRYASLHWHFFDSLVSANTHWLAPDNLQLDPEPVLALRTSPTNIGLQLLATISACDLGFLSAADLAQRLEQTFATLSSLPRFRGHFYNWYDLHDLRVLAPPYISTVDSGNIAGHLIAARHAFLEIAERQELALGDRLRRLAQLADRFVADMDFAFLYDETHKLFTIGFHPESFTADHSFYDLLASEARLASFLAIARNDVPAEHWFRLSRTLTRSGRATALVSWSGSMFEYLMPMLVMRSLPFTMLDQTYHSVVERHVAFGQSRRVPWGVSESAYNVRDHEQTYQYRGFGIPDLALKRGLDRELVIAPYATALAALIDPASALANFRALEALGALGEYGFFDALDYTRPAPGHRFAVVQTFMAHHVGMTLTSLANVLLDDIWQRRFHTDPLVKSAELLLHERVPRRLVMQEAQAALPMETRADLTGERAVVREVNTAEVKEPRIALLGSVPYSVMVNHNGSGFSSYESLAITRWRADGTVDDLGQFCYLKDLTAGREWSSGVQPIGGRADWSRAWLASDRVTLQRADGDIETKTEIVVVPGDSAEVRRVTVTNSGREPHDIELTSYSEVVMTTPDADHAHPAFSNLFVETEWHEWCTAITATRRPRAVGEPRLWCVHVVDTGRDRVGNVTCETDRARFIGRGRSVRNPAALDADGDLSGTTGSVLDPVLSLRTRVRVAPGQSVSVAFTTLVATTRELTFELAGRYHDAHAAQRALDVAWTSTQIELRELGITPASSALFQDLAAQVVFGGGSLAPPADELRRNVGSQPALWPHGISGDRPIVLATIDTVDGLPTLRELFAAHRFWRRRGVIVDLVVINGHPHDYLQELRDGISEAMIATNDASLIDQPGGVFVRRREIFRSEDYLMLSASSRLVISCDGRTLMRVLAVADGQQRDVAEQLTQPARLPNFPVTESAAERPGPLASIVSVLRPLVAPLIDGLPRAKAPRTHVARGAPPLRYENGIGGLDDRDDYVMTVDDAHIPPAPWVNVIANPHGGFLVSERGSGCTWAENAYFYRLTPWHNDPVTDPTSDVLFLQDDESGDLWGATPAPIGGTVPYQVRHGAGSSTFTHEEAGIRSELLLGTPVDAAVKVSRLTITNLSGRPRRLTLTAFVEWTLGAQREATQHQVITRFVPEHHAILAQNHFDSHFRDWTAFLATSEPVTSYSANRRTFLGNNGDLARPEALRTPGVALDGVTGVGLDSCAALQMQQALAPGETRVVTILLGAASTEAGALRTIERLRTAGQAERAIAQSVDAWRERLTVLTVRTPDAAFDAMINKWSLYQALSCRMWARTGLYQSSGAYGFRDQLQDVMAFVYAEPTLARAHILRAAARQFLEGDVQHWWHPHSGRGVRTHFSDDLVWLPYVVDQYVRVTGDTAVLDEHVPFLSMRALEPGEQELYDLPVVTDVHASIYEHCRRALRRACTVGPHGLPLMGSGDWNDGMNRVGSGGTGESVWLAWFLVATLRAFAAHAKIRGEYATAVEFLGQADAYVLAAETHAWDGQWYRRAFYDDGTPLGSASDDECRIDSIAQSWGVISGAASQERRDLSMRALNTQLVRDDARLIMLLTPPFDRGPRDPGYIKGYLPGVRENGAQYTHAALWAALATARQGDGDRAFELFQMLNPLTHTSAPGDVARYKVEPYAVAADVYTAPAHLGRGGWTWYTGSASWFYRVGVEDLLGFKKIGDTLRFEPRVPRAWKSFEMTYRFGATPYAILVRNPGEIQRACRVVVVDGVTVADGVIRLTDDGKPHSVDIS